LAVNCREVGKPEIWLVVPLGRRERWQYIRDWEEHKREAMRKFKQRWSTALAESEEKIRPLTRRIQ
jgi:hypothetical protein